MFKVVYQEYVIDIIKNPRFLKFITKTNIAITDKSNAQGIASSDGLDFYCLYPGLIANKKVVRIEDITIEEFSRLETLLNSGQKVTADEPQLAKAINESIKRLSTVCKNKITAGFSIELSDNAKYHFKLTTEDQLNLMLLEHQLSEGHAESFIYHATDQPCKIFNKNDMSRIIKAFRTHVLYHTTYFNAAKQYLKSLLDIQKVNLFTYGMDISDTVTDPALKQILKNGGNN